MSTVALAARMVLAVVFLTAGVGKLMDLPGSRQAMRDFGVPRPLADLGGVLLPLAELGTVAALVIRPSAQWGAVAAVLLLLGFMAGIANALRVGITPDCHCFGQIHSAPAGRGTLIRNGVLAAIGVLAIVTGPGAALDTWVSDHSAAVLAAIGLGAIAAVAAVYAGQLWLQARKLREDLSTAQRMAAGAPPGLPVGTPAPDFALASVEGATVTLQDLRGADKPVLLVFASPWCGSCLELFPSLRRWQQTLSERLTIAVVSTGSPKENELLTEEHGLEQVLLQDKGELIESYRIRGTPTAVLINSEGRVANVPAESVYGIEPMVRLVLREGSAAMVEGSLV